MKNLKFEISEQKLTHEEIKEFEKEFKVKLPDSLVDILLSYNGGVLAGKTMDEKIVYINGVKSAYSFSTLYSIKYGVNTIDDAIDTLQITEQHIPKEEIPFADDQGGNQYTISTREEDYGKIYLWYMDVGEPERVFVANSLEEFFTGKSEGKEE